MRSIKFLLLGMIVSVIVTVSPANADTSDGTYTYDDNGVIVNTVGYDGDPDTKTYPNRSASVGKTTGWRSSVYMVGDSLTWWGEPKLRAHGYAWDVNARPGRDVNMLPNAITERLANPSALGTVIIALGTNGAAPDKWTQAMFNSQINRLPAGTRVIFVTSYRDPDYEYNNAKYGPRQDPARQYWYSKWMIDLANTRPKTCVFNWRDEAGWKHPSLLRDGIHATHGDGEDWWATHLASTVSNCK